MSIACGFAVANVYLNQTLLVDMAKTFGSVEAEAGIVTTLTQVGYAMGNLLLVPLGDIFERRRLTVGTQANQVACQAKIFNLSVSARSRLNGLYMVCTFLGGALGSYIGVWAWTRWHWAGVCSCGMVMIAVGLSAAMGNKNQQEQPQTIS